jgi:deoxyribodipyrimidine photolyase
LKLKYDEPLSRFAFRLNVRPYRQDRELRRVYGGGGLHFHRGPHAPALLAAARQVNATTVFASQRYEPAHGRGDAAVAVELTTPADGGAAVELVTLPGHLLFDPEKIRIDMAKERYFFGTLMPFLHAAEKSGGKPGAPMPAPPAATMASLGAAAGAVSLGDERGARSGAVASVEELGLIAPSAVDWSAGFRAEFDMSESGAQEAWQVFQAVHLPRYEEHAGWLLIPSTPPTLILLILLLRLLCTSV